MKKRILSGVLCLLFLLPLFSAGALAAEPELKNGELSGDGIPDGWDVRSYLPDGYSAEAHDGIVTLSSSEYNDLRLTQLVTVEPGTAYILSAEISVQGVSGGRGASLSIDNYSIDGAYIYTDGILGGADWQTAELVFYTSPDQTEIVAALRLGGYSELSRGTARFRNVSLRVASEGAQHAQPLMAGYSAPEPADQKETGMTEARKIQLKSYLHLFVVLSVAIGTVLLFGFYRHREDLSAVELSDTDLRRRFVLTALAAIALRSVLCSFTGGHDTDMSCWIGWGNYIAQNGPSSFYTAPGHEWYDYPPAYMLVLGAISRLLTILRVPSGSDAAVFAYMLPACAADIATAALVMRAAKKRGFSSSRRLWLGLFVLFNPAAVVLSGAWGQIDSILTLLLLFSFLELLEERRISAGALYGLAIMVKWQALICGPVLAAAYLLRIRSKKDALQTFLAVVSALCVLFLFSLPFRGEQGAFWIASRFLHAAGGYDYASVEAYNFLALLGGNWAPASGKLLGGITYRAFGTVFIFLSVALAVYLQIRGQRRCEDGKGTVFLSAALCTYMIFTFGHYMHERYVFPVILFLLFAYVFTQESRLLLCSLLLSAVLFLNEVTAMFVVSDLAMSVVRSTREHQAVVRVCSAAEVISFLLFMKSCAEDLFSGRKGVRGNA